MTVDVLIPAYRPDPAFCETFADAFQADSEATPDHCSEHRGILLE